MIRGAEERVTNDMGNKHSKSRKQSKVAAQNSQKGQQEVPRHRAEHGEDGRQARPTGPPIVQQVGYMQQDAVANMNTAQ